MNYLTNYYKNLCEQLQEKVNILEAQIKQNNIPTKEQISASDAYNEQSERKKQAEQDKMKAERRAQSDRIDKESMRKRIEAEDLEAEKKSGKKQSFNNNIQIFR